MKIIGYFDEKYIFYVNVRSMAGFSCAWQGVMKVTAASSSSVGQKRPSLNIKNAIFQ